MLSEKLRNSVAIDIESGCWNWSKAKNKDGYGYVWFDGKMHRASRKAYEAFVGPVPEKLWVLHICDNPSCINPDHLFLGSHQDNANDRDRKLRQAKGDRHPNAKLTQAEVNHYKLLKDAARFFIGERRANQLAREISGIPKTTADHIDSGRRWKQ